MPLALHLAAAMVIALVVAVAMDFWAGLLHRRLWHRRLWSIHRSHHSARRGRFERNDLLSGLHAPMAVALIVCGTRLPAGLSRDLALGVGSGMTLFGAIYLTLHDGLVHGRLPVRALLRFGVLRAIVRAHRRHHRAGGGAPYGLLFGPWEFRRAARTAPATPSAHRPAESGPSTLTTRRQT